MSTHWTAHPDEPLEGTLWPPLDEPARPRPYKVLERFVIIELVPPRPEDQMSFLVFGYAWQESQIKDLTVLSPTNYAQQLDGKSLCFVDILNGLHGGDYWFSSERQIVVDGWGQRVADVVTGRAVAVPDFKTLYPPNFPSPPALLVTPATDAHSTVEPLTLPPPSLSPAPQVSGSFSMNQADAHPKIRKTGNAPEVLILRQRPSNSAIGASNVGSPLRSAKADESIQVAPRCSGRDRGTKIPVYVGEENAADADDPESPRQTKKPRYASRITAHEAYRPTTEYAASEASFELEGAEKEEDSFAEEEGVLPKRQAQPRKAAKTSRKSRKDAPGSGKAPQASIVQPGASIEEPASNELSKAPNHGARANTPSIPTFLAEDAPIELPPRQYRPKVTGPVEPALLRVTTASDCP